AELRDTEGVREAGVLHVGRKLESPEESPAILPPDRLRQPRDVVEAAPARVAKVRRGPDSRAAPG
ncbi:unnamed protein product, partial [Amoebophrya sp. A120]